MPLRPTSPTILPLRSTRRCVRGSCSRSSSICVAIAPACGDAQEQHFVTVVAGDDIGIGLAKTFEEGGFLSIDFGIALGDSARQDQRSPVYGDIGGGYSLGPFTIAGILGLTVQNEGCTNLCVSGQNEEPGTWHRKQMGGGMDEWTHPASHSRPRSALRDKSEQDSTNALLDAEPDDGSIARSAGAARIHPASRSDARYLVGAHVLRRAQESGLRSRQFSYLRT